MNIRKAAQEKGHTVVGKLRRIGDYVARSEIDSEEIGRVRVWIDEAENEYWIDAKRAALCIITYDGGVI